MHFELILPGLSWLAAGPGTHPARGLSLPALDTLLGLGSSQWSAPRNADALVGEAIGLADGVSHAMLRRQGEAGPRPPSGAHWLCCDPVHLHFSRDTLLLADASGLAITRDEADTLIAGLNDNFSDIGHFEAPAPERWYIRLAEAPRPRFHPLADVNGRPVQLFLPEGEDLRRWVRLSNEIEVWLYGHPVNTVRAEAGLRSINGVWLWGGGEAEATCAPRVQAVQAEQPFVRGLARLAGIEPSSISGYAHPAGNALAVVDSLQRPALHHDREAWVNALRNLESNWFAPLLADLKARRLQGIRIRVPDDRHLLQVDVAPPGLWKFWRKPRSLDALLATAPHTTATPP